MLEALGINDRISTGYLPKIRSSAQPDPFLEADAVPLADATDTLVRAVLGDGFSVPGAWLS